MIIWYKISHHRYPKKYLIRSFTFVLLLVFFFLHNYNIWSNPFVRKRPHITNSFIIICYGPQVSPVARISWNFGSNPNPNYAVFSFNNFKTFQGRSLFLPDVKLRFDMWTSVDGPWHLSYSWIRQTRYCIVAIIKECKKLHYLLPSPFTCLTFYFLTSLSHTFRSQMCS